MWISHHHADHICGFPLLLENINRARILYKRYNLTFGTVKKGDDGLNNGGFNDITMKSMNVIDKITVIAPPDVIRYYDICSFLLFVWFFLLYLCLIG
jgi:metal-dependent hydrolase (beta-lactamase superfamily II)